MQKLTIKQRQKYVALAEKYITDQLLLLLSQDGGLKDNDDRVWEGLMKDLDDNDFGIPETYTSIVNQARKNIRAALKTALARWK